MPGVLRAPFRSRRRSATARLGAVAGALVALVVLAGCDASENADVERVRTLFQSNCGTCHTLAEAGTTASVGPNLDDAFATARADGMDNDTIEGVVQTQIDSPRAIDAGVEDYDRVYMPPDIVTGDDAEDVATYVASVAGVPGAKPPELPPGELFTEQCGICHALQAAGTTATTGPDLDEALKGEDEAFIQKQIVDPNSQIAKGYQPNIMPQTFEQSLSSKDLQGLVDYLLQNAAK